MFMWNGAAYIKFYYPQNDIEALKSMFYLISYEGSAGIWGTILGHVYFLFEKLEEIFIVISFFDDIISVSDNTNKRNIRKTTYNF